jgi:hypothetical protein
LKARFAVNGIHSASSDAEAFVELTGRVSEMAMRSAVTVRRRSEVANVKSRLKNMRDDDDVGEDGSMSADENLEEVQRKLLEIQRR